MSATPDIRPAEQGSKQRLRLWLRLLAVTRKIEAELRERMRTEFDSTLPRFDVMAALSRNEQGLRMSALSGVLRVSNGNVTGIVDRLAEDGLVMRVPVAGDRRATLVRLTAKGAEVFARQAAEHEGWIDAMLAELSADEARSYAARLRTLAQRLDDKGASE
ncbi:MAG: MarR family transcriptional regulator [Paracoccaceae bacterium]|uniref:MarR family winged helix-turn-helix transcriptional regulator n=1 Tax=unclassified Seohaeicola TaxID=2641111 RepID=UPI00237ABDE6|nr:MULTISPECIES: MarR family transcriptional regulator [unclassified Seohaeicola]MDD9707646.1 MarR family transcriptional regulator [Seohaeicola sp. 4SK31]MDD9735887.1 MarR family transcriptional regulator [Seohaeicola sp. SP36]